MPKHGIVSAGTTLGCVFFALTWCATVAFAQGPFTPHPGLTITRAYTSQYGPDAEEFNIVTAVNRDGVALNYTDTRGIAAKRMVRSVDRQTAQTYLIGFDPRVPVVIPNTTSLGISSEALRQLRSTGVTAMSLMYDTRLSTIPGTLPSLTTMVGCRFSLKTRY